MKYRLFWAPEAEEDFDSQMRSLGRSTRKEFMSLVQQVNTALVKKPYDLANHDTEMFGLACLKS